MPARTPIRDRGARDGAHRIQLLPEALIDQIAAGEVVERPASVVKELVENALDAGASRVRVEVRDGGASRIAVGDDGSGMTPADARLALQRHATSKLRTARDLMEIGTFGFRGEALPAIASVSRLRLRTRTAEAADAFELRAEWGRVAEGSAAAGPPGTRIEVADLFGNVPARRKFLKTAITEWGHVADWLGRAALARPDVHFDLQRDARPATSWPSVQDARDRVAAVLSERDAASLVDVAGEEGAARVHGFVSGPAHHRPTAAGLYLYVNGRPVRDRLLRHALLHAYRDVLPRGRFPTALLFLELPAGAVDVNVHPAKWEVRFADPQSIHRLLSRALRDAFAHRAWLGGRGPTAPTLPHAPPAAGATPPVSDWILARPAAPDVPATAPARELAPPGATAPLAGESTRDEADRVCFAGLRPLGQLLAAYLLTEGPSGLILVDQHAAHERILYEQLRAGWLAGGVERQGLLLTETVELPPSALASLVDAPSAVAALGFELEAFGDDAVAVRAVPALLASRDPRELVRGLADELQAVRALGADVQPSSRTLDTADRVLATLACHAARRKGDRLDAREQQALLTGLDAIPWAPTCPHGRPVSARIGLDEIDRLFARR